MACSRVCLGGREGAWLVTVWLWDAPGLISSACGVSRDRGSAQRAARAFLASGQADTAEVQEAELVVASALDLYYRRTGGCWLARRTRGGAIRWHPDAARTAG